MKKKMDHKIPNVMHVEGENRTTDNNISSVELIHKIKDGNSKTTKNQY